VYQSTITIKLRTSILDVQGKAVELGIHTLGMKEVQHIRIGKSIEMTIDVSSEDEAKRITEESCKKLLANPVMEDFSYTIQKV